MERHWWGEGGHRMEGHWWGEGTMNGRILVGTQNGGTLVR